MYNQNEQNLKWADSHAHFHLYPEKYLHRLIRKLKTEKKLKIILNVATNINSYYLNKKLQSLFITNDIFVFLTLGIHPNEAKQYNALLKKDFEDALNEKLIVAIGEVGLDHYRYANSQEEKEQQKKLFIDQITYSQDLQLPLIIHVRDAFEDTYQILKRYLSKKDSIKGVIHCFSGNEEYLKKFIKLGFYISFAGNISFKNASFLQQSLISCPLDRLILETDSPYLCPEPFRGFFPNDPSFIEYTAKCISKIKKIDLRKLSESTINNTIKLFNLNQFNNNLAKTKSVFH